MGRRAGIAVGFAVLLAAAAVGLGGCSYSEPRTAPTGAPTTKSSLNSCTVLSVGEVGKGLGQIVTPGIRGNASVEGGVACVYYGPSVAPGADPDTPVPDSVRVVLVTGPKAQPWYQDYLAKVAPITIKNLGEDAFYDGTASVNVLEGSSYLRISVIKTTGSDEAAEIALATIASPRL